MTVLTKLPRARAWRGVRSRAEREVLTARVERQADAERLLARRALRPLEALRDAPCPTFLFRHRLQRTKICSGPRSPFFSIFHSSLPVFSNACSAIPIEWKAHADYAATAVESWISI
jgi:hypothetical protein